MANNLKNLEKVDIKWLKTIRVKHKSIRVESQEEMAKVFEMEIDSEECDLRLMQIK